MTVERLEAEAMKLPLRERALLAQRLLASLDEDEIEQAWEDVAERRYQLYLAGEMETVSASDAMAEIMRRSDAHRRDPGEAVPLDEALDRIERSL
ncbi:MAG TPA: addiction module protein [Longimicrobiaceae bacterium]|jgi:hypothetical protein